MSYQDTPCPVGNYGSIAVNLKNQSEQDDRLEEIAMALRHLKTVVEAIAYDRIAEQEISAVTYFTARALNHIIETESDAALKYSMEQTSAAKWNGAYRPRYGGTNEQEQGQ